MRIEQPGRVHVDRADPPGLVTRREALRRVAWLLGGAVSAPTVSGVLAGCGRPASNGAAAAGVLSGEQAELVAVIAEHILPETDTPGARAAGVHEFIDEMLAEYYPAAERDRFLAGLTEVDERAVEAHGVAFLECSPEQQLAVLTELDREAFDPSSPRTVEGETPSVPEEMPDEAATQAGAGDPGDATAPSADAAAAEPPAGELGPADREWIWGEQRPAPADTDVPFMRRMKELTLVGYYTSEVGATQELRHEAVPGRFDGCVPFTEIGRTWAVS